MDDSIRSVIARNIVETVPVGLLVINPEGEISVRNDAACRILGYPQEAFSGKGIAELFFVEEENYLFNEFIVEVIEGEKYDLQRTVPYTRPSGELLQLVLTASFLRDHENKPALVILMDDVTQTHLMHQNEKAILKENNRIQRERAESLNRLALAVAHQLRNPATAIGGFALLMLKKMGDESPFADHLRSILKDAERLEQLVKAVEDYARIPQVELTEVPLASVLEEAVRLAEQRTRGSTREVEWEMRTQPMTVFIDSLLFKEALCELFINSIEAAEPGCCFIKISAEARNDICWIEIADRGRGIQYGDRPFVFDPFFSTKAVGVGLGLCKARRIVFEHNGNIYLNERPGGGTIATLELPLRDTVSTSVSRAANGSTALSGKTE